MPLPAHGLTERYAIRSEIIPPPILALFIPDLRKIRDSAAAGNLENLCDFAVYAEFDRYLFEQIRCFCFFGKFVKTHRIRNACIAYAVNAAQAAHRIERVLKLRCVCKDIVSALLRQFSRNCADIGSVGKACFSGKQHCRYRRAVNHRFRTSRNAADISFAVECSNAAAFTNCS